MTISFLAIESVVGGMGVFLPLGSLTLVAVLYFWPVDTETYGKSLRELQRELTGRAVG